MAAKDSTTAELSQADHKQNTNILEKNEEAKELVKLIQEEIDEGHNVVLRRAHALLNFQIPVFGNVSLSSYRETLDAASEIIFQKYFTGKNWRRHPPAYCKACRVWGEKRSLLQKGHPEAMMQFHNELLYRSVKDSRGVLRHIITHQKDCNVDQLQFPRFNTECLFKAYTLEACLQYCPGNGPEHRAKTIRDRGTQSDSLCKRPPEINKQLTSEELEFSPPYEPEKSANHTSQ